MLRYLRYITPRRLLNELSCRMSYALSALGIYSWHHQPTFFSLEPADYCMLRCPECPVGMRGAAAEAPHHLLSLDLARKAIDRFAPTAHTCIFHFQGEPLLNDRLPDMVAYAHSRRLFTMLSTNAQLLTPDMARRLAEAGLDRIVISLDGLTQEVYERYRVGGSLQRVLAGMQAMAAQKSRPEIVLQCLCLRSNEHQWSYFRKQYRELGADRLEMKTAQFYNLDFDDSEIPMNTRFSRYRRGADGRYRLKRRLHNRCYRLWSGVVVTTDGILLPCCYDKEHHYPLGSVAEGFTPAAEQFRLRLLQHRSHLPICTNCNE